MAILPYGREITDNSTHLNVLLINFLLNAQCRKRYIVRRKVILTFTTTLFIPRRVLNIYFCPYCLFVYLDSLLLFILDNGCFVQLPGHTYKIGPRPDCLSCRGLVALIANVLILFACVLHTNDTQVFSPNC